MGVFLYYVRVILTLLYMLPVSTRYILVLFSFPKEKLKFSQLRNIQNTNLDHMAEVGQVKSLT